MPRLSTYLTFTAGFLSGLVAAGVYELYEKEFEKRHSSPATYAEQAAADSTAMSYKVQQALKIKSYPKREAALNALSRKEDRNQTFRRAVTGLAQQNRSRLGESSYDALVRWSDRAIFNPDIQAAIVYSLVSNAAREAGDYREAERLAGNWMDANGRTPLRGIDIYRGDVVMTPGGLMRTDRSKPWTSYSDKSEMTSSQSYTGSRGETVVTERYRIGASPSEAAAARQRQQVSEGMKRTHDDVNRAIQGGKQAVGSALQGIFRQKK